MNTCHVRARCLVAALAVLGIASGWSKVTCAEPGQTDVDPGMQVLTRGPVHEAFAVTVTFDPEPGVVIPQTPPTAIEELPPAGAHRGG